jgi:subtilisin-like proprotein convertase family protein
VDTSGAEAVYRFEVANVDEPAYAIYGLNLNGRYDDALYPGETVNVSFIVGNSGGAASTGGQVQAALTHSSVQVMQATAPVPALAPGERATVTEIQVRVVADAGLVDLIPMQLNWRMQEGATGASPRRLRVSRALLTVQPDFGNPSNPEDGGIAPGTNGQFYVTFTNAGSDLIREGTVALRAVECAEAMTPTIVLPAIAPGESARLAAPITMRVPANCTIGTAVRLAFEGSYQGQVMRLPIASTAAFAAGITRAIDQAAAIPTPIPIPDSAAAGVMASTDVMVDGTVRTISVGVRITHPFIGDLVVQLVHPDGTVAALHTRTGGNADNIYLTYGEGGEAAQALTGLVGKPLRGTWKLKVVDAAGGDVGSLDAFTLKIRGFAP